jgi:hypothetical protein
VPLIRGAEGGWWQLSVEIIISQRNVLTPICGPVTSAKQASDGNIEIVSCICHVKGTRCDWWAEKTRFLEC